MDDSKKIIPFDLEWSYSDNQQVPLNFIIFRGFNESFSRLSTVSIPEKNTPLNIAELSASLMYLLDIPIKGKEIINFIQKELEFQKNATGQFFNINIKISTNLKTRVLA